MTLTEPSWPVEAETLLPELVDLRRAIHREPELGLQNPKTLAKIKHALAGLPLEIREGPSTTGLVAILRGGRDNGRTVLLRGDHGCAADAGRDRARLHVEDRRRDARVRARCAFAMLVGAAKMLCAARGRTARHGGVHVPARRGGLSRRALHARRRAASISLPEAAFALHIIAQRAGRHVRRTAGAAARLGGRAVDHVKGAGGQASMPHDAVDPIPVACEIVTALQTMVTRAHVRSSTPRCSRSRRSAAGTTHNIIPARPRWTARCARCRPKRRAQGAQREFERLVPAYRRGARRTGEVEIEQGFPVTMNDARAVTFGAARLSKRPSAARAAGRRWRIRSWARRISPTCSRKCPVRCSGSASSRRGAIGDQCCALHRHQMVLEEKVMARGAALHAALAERFLNKGFEA